MADAIIGATGFVGTNLVAAHDFSARFSSKNIVDIDGGRYDTVVCAAAPAAMWAANRDPKGDLANILTLIAHLERVTARNFVLVSTVAVLADPAAGLDETTDRFETVKAYGRNRRRLEEAVTDLFPRSHILRLPALFGLGLKKNFVFDIQNPVPSFLTAEKYAELGKLLPAPAAAILRAVYSFATELGMYRCKRECLVGHERARLTEALFDVGFTAMNFTNADSTFQYYGLARLWSDIGRVISANVPVIHLAPEPLRAGDVAAALTGRLFEARSAVLYREDMHSRHADLWGFRGTYIQDAASVLSDLVAFHTKAPP